MQGVPKSKKMSSIQNMLGQMAYGFAMENADLSP